MWRVRGGGECIFASVSKHHRATAKEFAVVFGEGSLITWRLSRLRIQYGTATKPYRPHRTYHPTVVERQQALKATPRVLRTCLQPEAQVLAPCVTIVFARMLYTLHKMMHCIMYGDSASHCLHSEATGQVIIYVPPQSALDFDRTQEQHHDLSRQRAESVFSRRPLSLTP